MKVSQAMKSCALAAALAVAAPTFAASVVTNAPYTYTLDTKASYGALVFSKDAMDTLGVVQIAVSGGGTTVQSTTSIAGDTLTQPTTDWTMTGNAVNTLSFIGSIVNLKTASAAIKLSDFSFDVATLSLNGKMTTSTGTTALTIFTADSLTGVTTADTSIIGRPQTITDVVNGLHLTAGATSILGTALGVPQIFWPTLEAINFGKMNASTTATVTAAVPEPSTYGLMGMGLVGATVAARRRKAA